MGRLRHLGEQLEQVVEARGFRITDRGLEKPRTGITIQSDTEYYLGASSSPKHIIVVSANDEWIEYVQEPDYKKKIRIERWVGEDLIMQGVETWLRTWGGESYPWVRATKASLEAMLKGGKGKTTKVSDFYPIEVKVKPVGKTPQKAWNDAERYGGVAGGEDYLLIDMKQGGLDELKKDKRFEVLDVKDISGRTY